MIIRSLTLTNYRRFERLALEFRGGLTVVKGPNEAGKSTVLSALLLALFEDPRSRKSELDHRRRWGQDRYFRVETGFDCDGHAYALDKDFEAKTERLTDITTGEELSERGAVSAKLSEMLGIGSEELFRSTACVAQNSIALITDKGKRQISDQLQAIMTGGAEDTAATQAVAALQAEAANLRRGFDRPASNPGAVRLAQDTVARLREDLAAKESEMERVRESADVSEEAGREIAAKSERLSAIRALLSNNEKRARLCAERDQAAAAEDSLQKQIESAEQLRKSIGEKKRAIREFDKFSDMSADTPQMLATLEATLRVHVSAEETAEEELERAEAGARAARTPMRRLLLAGFICSLIIAVVLFTSARYPGFAFSLLAAGVFFYFHQSTASTGKDASRKADEAEERLDRIRKQIQVTYEEQQTLVKSSGCASAEEMRKRWSEWSQLKLETARSEAELSGKLAGLGLDEMERERKKLAKTRRDAEERLDTEEMRTADLDAVERQQIAIEAQRLEDELAELEGRRALAQAVIRTVSLDPAEIHRVEEALAAEDGRLARVERLARVYTIAAEGVKEAIGRTLSGAKPQLEADTGRLLASVTGGRYSRVEVDEQSLDFAIYSNEKGALVEAGDTDLSRGALDQFYLAARIALLDLVSGDAKPPVLLDDPFGAFDDERAGRAMEMLKQISRERQAVLFTCSDRYDAYADTVIHLGASDLSGG
ncbi:MAG: AAA family ATPase [Armatimonadota bacterium]|nr:AAA family ATPase [Armatimonadota bacterium]